jgi:hypothetical protein
MDEINIEEYTSDRQKENISVEINENENLDINYFKNTRSNVNDVHNMHKVIYAEDKDEKITRLTYLLTLEEMKRNNLLYNNNKLRYENVLKQIIIKKHIKPNLDINKYIIKNINPLIIRDNNNKTNTNFTYFTSIPDNIQYNIDKYNEYINYMSKKYNYINLENLCIDYINSLHWIKDSYFNGKINNWIYKSIFSPLLSQLYIVLNNNIDLLNKFSYSTSIID